MPTYEYACKQCGEHLEAVQSFNDDPLTVCPNCGGELRKVFGSVGIVFKGSGFYKTDSRSNGKPAKTPEPASTKSDGAGGDSGTSAPSKPEKSESKPATTTSESKPAAAAS